MSVPPRRRAERFAYPLVLVVVWLAFFSPAILGGRVFFYRDLFFFQEPLRRYWISVVSAGHAPFLNTALNLGEPALANPNNAVFYPGNVLYFLLPFGTAWNISLAAHVLWAALGLYWLARRLDCARPAALSGALVFAFCGPLVSSLNYYTLLIAASWIPWTLGFALMAWRHGGTWTAATALALALQVFAGEPTPVILTAGLVGCGYAIGLLRDPSRYRTVLGRGLFIAVAAVLVSSIQTLPTLLWLPHSGRAGGLPFRESVAYWSLHPARFAEFLVPRIFGNPTARLASDFWGGGFSDSGMPYIMKLYAGWIPLLLLPLALRRSIGRWTALVFASSLALSLGHRLFGYHLLYDLFPPLRIVRYPEKFTILAGFALALATSIALPMTELATEEEKDREDRKRRILRTRVVLLTASGVLLAVLPLLVYALPHGALSAGQRAEQLGAIGAAALVGVVSSCLLFLGTVPRYGRIAAGLIPAVIALDLAAVTWDIARTRPRVESDRTPALLANLVSAPSTPILHLGEKQSDAYFLSQRDPFQSMQDALHPFTGLRWGVVYGAVDDIDRLGWKIAEARERALHQALLSAPDPGGDGAQRVSEALSVMRACGIGRVVSLAPLSIEGLRLESTLSLPDGPTLRVYATNSGSPSLARFDGGEGALTWKAEAPHRISLLVDSPAESTIVVARNALEGWSAVCDGRAIVLSSSREGLLRLSVPSGVHHVDLAYTPPGLLTGALLTASGLFALAGSVFLARRAASRS